MPDHRNGRQDQRPRRGIAVQEDFFSFFELLLSERPDIRVFPQTMEDPRLKSEAKGLIGNIFCA